MKIVDAAGVNAVQLHGDESTEFCRILKAHLDARWLIKVLRVTESFVPPNVQPYAADAVMLEQSLASSAILGSLRERGAGIFVWTAKDADTLARLADLAPDGIMSDALGDHLSLTA
mgnify:CR=1 FL=1